MKAGQGRKEHTSQVTVKGAHQIGPSGHSLVQLGGAFSQKLTLEGLRCASQWTDGPHLSARAAPASARFLGRKNVSAPGPSLV